MMENIILFPGCVFMLIRINSLTLIFLLSERSMGGLSVSRESGFKKSDYDQRNNNSILFKTVLSGGTL